MPLRTILYSIFSLVIFTLAGSPASAAPDARAGFRARLQAQFRAMDKRALPEARSELRQLRERLPAALVEARKGQQQRGNAPYHELARELAEFSTHSVRSAARSLARPRLLDQAARLDAEAHLLRLQFANQWASAQADGTHLGEHGIGPARNEVRKLLATTAPRHPRLDRRIAAQREELTRLGRRLDRQYKKELRWAIKDASLRGEALDRHWADNPVGSTLAGWSPVDKGAWHGHHMISAQSLWADVLEASTLPPRLAYKLRRVHSEEAVRQARRNLESTEAILRDLKRLQNKGLGRVELTTLWRVADEADIWDHFYMPVTTSANYRKHIVPSLLPELSKLEADRTRLAPRVRREVRRVLEPLASRKLAEAVKRFNEAPKALRDEALTRANELEPLLREIYIWQDLAAKAGAMRGKKSVTMRALTAAVDPQLRADYMRNWSGYTLRGW